MTEQEKFARAVALAAEKHKNQTRRDGTPYIYHPMKVAEIVKTAGYGIPYQITAMFHDLLEDTDATEAQIGAFGEDILTAVKLLTRPEGIDETEYVAAICANPIACVVKAADKINNLWDSVFFAKREWARKYMKKSVTYYEGKFCPAVDRSIEEVSSILAGEEMPPRLYPFYTAEELKPYQRG